MDIPTDINVVYENGVFRPEQPVNFPERSRLRISVHQSEDAPIQNGVDATIKNGVHNRETFAEMSAKIRAQGLYRTGGRLPTREELHDRNYRRD